MELRRRVPKSASREPLRRGTGGGDSTRNALDKGEGDLDDLQRLDVDAVTLCLSFLGVKDLARLSSCSRQWREGTSEACRPALWVALFSRYFEGLFVNGVDDHCAGEGHMKDSIANLCSRMYTIRRLSVLTDDGAFPPGLRFLHRIAVCDEDGYAYLMGGDGSFGGGSSVLNDLWRLPLSAINTSRPQSGLLRWELVQSDSSQQPGSQVASENFRPPKCCAASWTSLGCYIYLFGGAGSPNHSFFNELWRWDVKNSLWQKVGTPDENTWPSGRWGHTAVAYSGKLWIFGGSKPGAIYNDLWYLDPSQVRPLQGEEELKPQQELVTSETLWTKVECGQAGLPVPPCRGGHCASLVGSKMVIFGGNSLEESFNDTWWIDLDQPQAGWECAPPSSPSPSARIGHSALTVGDGRIFMFGGRDIIRTAFRAGAHFFDLKQKRWFVAKRSQASLPLPLVTGHAIIPCSWGAVVWGGLSMKKSIWGWNPQEDACVCDLRSLEG